jgi:hypothetical protein
LGEEAAIMTAVCVKSSSQLTPLSLPFVVLTQLL